MNDTIAKQIWSYIWSGNKEEISKLIDNYEPYSDEKFSHPILMESAHQTGNNPDKPGLDKEKVERFTNQNILFKYLWLHPKFKKLWHNGDYTDKYGFTALQRLRSEYRYYNDDLKGFVRDNILPNIDDIIVVEDDWGIVRFSNNELFGEINYKNDSNKLEPYTLDIDSIYGK